jgi:hypothetical protein
VQNVHEIYKQVIGFGVLRIMSITWHVLRVIAVRGSCLRAKSLHYRITRFYVRLTTANQLTGNSTQKTEVNIRSFVLCFSVKICLIFIYYIHKRVCISYLKIRQIISVNHFIAV